MHVLFWVVKHNCREHFQHAVAEMICKMQANEFSCEMHLQNKLRNSIAEKRGNYVLLKIWKLEDKFQIVVSRLGLGDTRTARSPGPPVDQAAEPPEPLGRQSRSVAWSTGGKATALRILYMRLHIAVALRIKRFDPIASLLQPQIEIYL